MKKIICILIIIISCICSTAVGDTHIGIQGTVLSENTDNHKSVLFDIFRYDEGTILTTSSLTPDHVIRNSDEYQNLYHSINMLFGLTPEKIALFTEKFDEIYREWLNTRYTVLSEGVYTGTLFGKASTVCVAEYMLSDLTQFIKNHYSDDAESGYRIQSTAESCNMLMDCFTCFAESLSAEYNPLVRMKSYDEGRYITYELLQQDQVILIMSLDYSKENAKRILITHKENNRYYFRDVYVRYDRGAFDLLNRLYGGNSPFYENLFQEDLIICEHFSLVPGDLGCSFTYDCENDKADKIVSAAGSISSEKMEAGIFLQNSKSENIILSASKDDVHMTENTSDTSKVLDNNNVSDNNEYRIAFMSGLSFFLAEAVPMLPVSSQKLLYLMLFGQ